MRWFEVVRLVERPAGAGWSIYVSEYLVGAFVLVLLVYAVTRPSARQKLVLRRRPR